MATDRVRSNRSTTLVRPVTIPLIKNISIHNNVLSFRPRSGFSFLPTADGIVLHGKVFEPFQPRIVLTHMYFYVERTRVCRWVL